MSLDLQRLTRNGWLRRIDAALGEWVLRTFPDSAPSIGLAAALAARAIADGHSALQLDAAQAWLAALGGRGDSPELPDAQIWRAALRGSSAVALHPLASSGDTPANQPLILDEQDRVYLRRYFDYEAQLARALIARASAHRLQLITGGPGTGKTTSVMRIAAQLAQQASQTPGRSLNIALAAPTGNAAARLAQSVRAQKAALALPPAIAAMIPERATTLHNLLGLSPYRAQPKFHHDAPLPYNVVIVDEVSMVDLPLMAKLVDAVAPHAWLVLLGDPRQLAAVEAGDVLGALVEAAHENPLRDCATELSQSHRFVKHGALGRLAVAIAEGDADAALATLAEGKAVKLTGKDARGAAQALIEPALREFQLVLDADDATGALAASKNFRILTALRHGASGCVALNHAIEQRLKRGVGARMDDQWWRGRLILVTANRAGSDPTQSGLFNGDIGVVWPDADGKMKVWFEGNDGSMRALAPAALPPHEGAFALTVHKAQGSEFDRVTLVPGADSPVWTRELLYTGVTRARIGMHIHCDEALLRRGIARRIRRWNGLADRLREAAAHQSEAAAANSSPLSS